MYRPVTLIDSPGFDDPEKNQDAEIISDLVDKLQDMNEVHQILIAVNGTNPRLDGSMKAMIDIFQRMFTTQIWENIGIVFTKLPMDQASVERWENSSQQSYQEFADAYVGKLKGKFEIKSNIEPETFFIDSC